MLQRATNYFDDLFVRSIGDGVTQRIAIERVATAYLDGKPLPVGKKKLTRKERDILLRISFVEIHFLTTTARKYIIDQVKWGCAWD